MRADERKVEDAGPRDEDRLQVLEALEAVPRDAAQYRRGVLANCIILVPSLSSYVAAH